MLGGMWRSLAVFGMLVATGAMASSGPPPCPGVPFQTDQALFDVSAPPDTITVDAAGMTSIAGRCDPVLGRWHRRVDGSVTLRARWLACGAFANVRLRLRYDA